MLSTLLYTINFNNTVVAACGHYVCADNGNDVMSGEGVTLVTWCDNIGDCSNGDVDEMYCTKKFQCMYWHVRNEISKSRECDKRCECPYCNDEWNCNGYRYHYWYKCNNSRTIPSYYICDDNTDCIYGEDESNCGNVTTCVTGGYSTDTYIFANYSRCTSMVWCNNKLDQTNCSDSTLSPLQCPINGYMSTVSEHIICRSIVYTEDNRYHSNFSAVCDHDMDIQCVEPSPGCYMHKHQLCNNIADCAGDSDGMGDISTPDNSTSDNSTPDISTPGITQ